MRFLVGVLPVARQLGVDRPRRPRQEVIKNMSNRHITLSQAAAASAELAIQLTGLAARTDLPSLFCVRFYNWFNDYPGATALLDTPSDAGDLNAAVVAAIEAWAAALGADVSYAAPEERPLRPGVMRQRISASRKYESGARFTVYDHIYLPLDRTGHV